MTPDASFSVGRDMLQGHPDARAAGKWSHPGAQEEEAECGRPLASLATYLTILAAVCVFISCLHTC